jgi:folate-binding protein YgfZ
MNANAPQRSRLDGRGVLSISGADWREYLQGLVSNDVRRVAPDRAVYAAMLTPQGKFLHDFFMVADGDALLLDCDADGLADLSKRLTMFKLRADVSIADVSTAWRVEAVFGDGAAASLDLAPERGSARSRANGGGIAYVDPRLAEAGVRLLIPVDGDSPDFPLTNNASYDRHRLALGLPDGRRDMVAEKATLLESGFDELAGVDWDKGCYMGQELTARTKYRGLIKKRLVPVAITGPMPAAGTPIMAGEREAGEMRSGVEGLGMALMRLEHLSGDPVALTCGDASITPHKPDWASF